MLKEDIEIIDMDLLVENICGNELASQVILKPYDEHGEVMLFRDFTHQLALEQFQSSFRHTLGLVPVGYNVEEKIQRFYRESEQQRNFSHQVVEQYSRLGAIASILTPEGGKVYELGCGIATPSISYALLTGKEVTAIDSKESEIKNAKRIANLKNAKINLVGSTAERFLESQSINLNDLFIISGPDGSLNEFWMGLLKYNSTIIYNGIVPFDRNSKSEEQLINRIRYIATHFVNHYGHPNKYENIKVGYSKSSPAIMTIVASK